MNKSEMLNQLISYYSGGNKSAFAKMLGIKPQSVNTWIIRNTFDTNLIYSKCNNVSAEWLLTGEGNMLKKDGSHVDYSGIIADKSRNNTVAEPKYSYEENADRIIKIPLRQIKDLVRDKILELVESGRFYPAQLVRNMIKDKDKEILELREKVSDLEKKLNAMGHAPRSEEIVNEKGR